MYGEVTRGIPPARCSIPVLVTGAIAISAASGQSCAAMIDDHYTIWRRDETRKDRIVLR